MTKSYFCMKCHTIHLHHTAIAEQHIRHKGIEVNTTPEITKEQKARAVYKLRKYLSIDEIKKRYPHLCQE